MHDVLELQTVQFYLLPIVQKEKIRKGSREHTVWLDDRIRTTLSEAKVTLGNIAVKDGPALLFIFPPQKRDPVLTKIWLRHRHRPLWYWRGSSCRMVAHVIQWLIHSFSRILPCCNFFYVTEKVKIKQKFNRQFPRTL